MSRMRSGAKIKVSKRNHCQDYAYELKIGGRIRLSDVPIWMMKECKTFITLAYNIGRRTKRYLENGVIIVGDFDWSHVV